MDRKTGLYSKAAQIIRSLPQEKGTAEQMIAAAKKMGVKDAELAHARPPTGKITREELAQHFESRLPKLRIEQYGDNPSYLSRDENQRRIALQTSARRGQELTPEEKAEAERLQYRVSASPNTLTQEDEDTGVEEPLATTYEDYTLPGGKNYRERLLKLDSAGHPAVQIGRNIDSLRRKIDYERPIYGSDDHPVMQANMKRLSELEQEREKAIKDYGPVREGVQNYQSNHWSGHPNVLAHIRLSDREVGMDRDTIRPIAEKLAAGLGIGIRDMASAAASVGVQNKIITPEEAADLSRFMGWRNGYDQARGNGKRLLHVEELQSDWAQEGRDKGFHDPANPYEIFETKTGKTVSKHPTYAAMWDAFRSIPEEQAAGLDYGSAMREKPPEAPYVTNTQHWTDLALKNVLREAALGNYDGVVFTPGQAQADRYGLEKEVDSIKYWPQDRTLSALQGNSTRIAKQDVGPEDLPSLIGKELSEKLLHPSSVRTSEFDGSTYHMLQGEDMKVGGDGMKGYYDNIVPKSVMNLARQHDPSIKPAEPMQLPDGYQGFHLPMTDQLKSSILDKGFPAMKRGGRVGFSQGGSADDQSTPTSPAAPAAQGSVPVAGGIRGGTGLFQAQDEKPLEGLPPSVRIPLTGEVIQAGPDPRIRAVTRAYMAQSGLPYNPPTKYAKVDPDRARRIADAYEKMPHNPEDPLTKASYDAMIKETLAQYQAAKAAGFKAEFWNPRKEKDPYEASPRLAVEDVRKNHHMWVYPTLDGYGSGDAITEEEARRNPMLQLTGETWNGIPVTVNDIFRAVHDYYGHAKEGVGFRHDGEENAWRSHASMFSPLARLAMTTETRGQNSWLNFGPHGEKNQTARTEDTVFAPQKMGILPHWVHHEGAEDFMSPQDISAMARARAKHDDSVSKALAITRGFTKDGAGAMMRLKP